MFLLVLNVGVEFRMVSLLGVHTLVTSSERASENSFQLMFCFS